MKKTYTKPVIEGELFEVNEAVAACWLITPVSGDSWYVQQEPTGNGWHIPTDSEINDDGFFQGFPTSTWYYSKNARNADGADNARWGIGIVEIENIHKVTSSEAHPNASV